MSIFGRIFSRQGDLDFPLASRMAKIATFGVFVDGIRKKQIPLSLKGFIRWSNSWLAPDLSVEDTGKKIAVYYDHPINGSRHRYYQESYKWFSRNLWVGSKFKVTYNGLTDKERPVYQYLAQGLIDALQKYILDTLEQGNEPGSFDANEILKILWEKSVGDLNARVESSLIDRL